MHKSIDFFATCTFLDCYEFNREKGSFRENFTTTISLFKPLVKRDRTSASRRSRVLTRGREEMSFFSRIIY